MSALLLILAAAVTVPAPVERCDAPVFLVVQVDHFDRDKSRPYADGLRSSGIVKRNGGRYRVAGTPLMVLEGSWPADRGFVIEQYPCVAAFRSMWFSDDYQKRLKPLREGSGDYTITLFNVIGEAVPALAK